MENVRIAVLDQHDRVVGFLDNSADNAMHYYDEELHPYLTGSAYTFSFKTYADYEDIDILRTGNHLSFVRMGADGKEREYYLNIISVENDGEEVAVESYGLLFELITEDIKPYRAESALSFIQYVQVFGFDSSIINIGINEVSDKRITHEWSSTDTVLSRLYSLATVFDAEIEFVTELNDDYSLKRLTMNVYHAHDDKYQGMGTDRSAEILRFGDELTLIRSKEDISELYTAIRPKGNDDLTLTGMGERVVRDSDGEIEYIHYSGSDVIFAPQAKELYPATALSTADGWIAHNWEYQTDNIETLYGQALAQLKKNSVPQISYDVEGFIDAQIGDTFTLADERRNPTLYVKARIVEQIICFTDETRNKTTFDNFTTLQSQVSNSMMERMAQMIEASRMYTGLIISSSGTVFKNNTGSTVLTARVMDGTTDVTDKMIIRWFKDGTSLSTGKTITVTASQVADKALYRFDAYKNDVLKSTAEVTVTDVSDGVNGDDGITPTITVSKVSGTTTVKITDGTGTKTAEILDGEKGDKGDKGDTGAQGPQGIQGVQGIQGETGAQGPQGDKGDKGDKGDSPTITTTKSGKTTTIKADGVSIGTIIDGTDGQSPTVSKSGKTVTITDASGTTVTITDGEDGASIKGDDGDDAYFHIAWANSADGTTDFSTTVAANKLYMGTYTDHTPADSTTPSKYKWVKVKGEQGIQGVQGEQGAKGDKGDSPVITATKADGKTTVKADGVTIATINDGQDGTNGTPGANGYVHIAWANSSDGKTDFSTSVSTGKTYLGSYTDNTQADSTDPTRYSWSLIKGEKGDKGDTGDKGDKGDAGSRGALWFAGTGITGTSTTATAFPNSGISSAVIGDMYLNTSTYNTYKCTVAGNASTAKWAYVNNIKGQTGSEGKGISSIVREYYLSTSNTSQTGGSWGTTIPAYVNGRYYWTRDKVTWTNPAGTTYTTAVLDSGLNGANSVAASAVSTANTAKSTADTAKSTADTAKSTADSAQSDIDNLQIGGRNLLLKTDVPVTWTTAHNANKFGTRDLYQTYMPVKDIFEIGDLVTVSFDWSTDATGGSFRVECGNVTPWGWGDVVLAKGTDGAKSYTTSVTSSKQSGHIEITFRITSAQKSAGETFRWLRIRTDGDDLNGKSFTVSNAKAERGNRATDWTPAPEDTTSDIEYANTQIYERVSADMQVLNEQVRSIVSADYYTVDQANMLVQRINTITSQLNQTASNITALFTQVQAAQSTADGAANTLQTWFNFDSNGLGIGKSDSGVSMLLTNDRLGFYLNGAEVAYLSESKLFITDGTFLGSLQLGNFAFVPNSAGNLSFKKVVQ